MKAIKTYPTPDELKFKTVNQCPETGCSKIFKTQSNLNMHLAKTHKKESFLSSPKKEDREFHCPELSCVYHGDRMFKTLKLLKQHYVKVHSAKDIVCEKCGKGFGVEFARNSHREYCGVTFKCLECEAVYESYEGLMTHSRRKKHHILSKLHFKPGYEGVDLSNKVLLRKEAPMQVMIMVETIEKGIQTEFKGKLKNVVKTEIETQTSRNRDVKCVETQTFGEYFAKKSTSDGSIENLSQRITTDTQTNAVISSSKSCNTSFELNKSKDGDVVKTTFSTQTLPMLGNIFENPSAKNELNFEFTDISCQTSFNENFDEDFLNCNSETQTESILNGDFDIDFYTNMYTQTCEDLLPVDMEFNHSHTQTVMDDILRSVGSQTVLNTCRDMAHNETQTDLVFKQMLEEINA